MSKSAFPCFSICPIVFSFVLPVAARRSPAPEQTGILHKTPVNGFFTQMEGKNSRKATAVAPVNKSLVKQRKAAWASKDPYRMNQTILTHCHPDHAGNASEIKSALNVPVYAYQGEALLTEQGICCRVPYRRSPGIANWLIFNVFIRSVSKKNAPVNIEEMLEDNELLSIASQQIR